MRKVIILGNDHTNTLGLTQVLGMSMFYVIVYAWGTNRGIVKSSRFCKEFYSAHTVDECMNRIINSNYGIDGIKIPIIASCDSGALSLDKYKSQLKGRFLFEYITSQFTLHQLMEKKLQVNLAKEAGFNVPVSWEIIDIRTIPDNLVFPCLIKPLVSCNGAKVDIRVCQSTTDYKEQLATLKHTTEIIVQQYIERDYEISILGCALSNGEVIIPAVENKLTLYPKYVGLECLARMDALEDINIIQPINNLIKSIGYVGLFSVEMMHSKVDNKFYFTEINLRNDGANSFVYKYGVNLPLNHIEDLLGSPITKFSSYKPGYYIWDMHHFQSLGHGDIKLRQWLKEIRMSRGFLTYFKNDKKPFVKQYLDMLGRKLGLIKLTEY